MFMGLMFAGTMAENLLYSSFYWLGEAAGATSSVLMFISFILISGLAKVVPRVVNIGLLTAYPLELILIESVNGALGVMFLFLLHKFIGKIWKVKKVVKEEKKDD